MGVPEERPGFARALPSVGGMGAMSGPPSGSPVSPVPRRVGSWWQRGAAGAGAQGVLGAASGGYRGLLNTREWLYARGVLHSRALPCAVVSVGNLTVGGTGKTP